MNNRIYLLFAIIFVACSSSYIAFAQDESDALRYSTISSQGTARSMGFGNALGSIGGDFSGLSVNPAGIGIYRKSELTFTPSLKLNSTSSDYMNQSTDDNNTRFTVNNLGAVFTNTAKGKRYKKSDWKSISFGVGINRIADFNRNYSYQGTNNTSSISLTYELDALNYPADINNTVTLAGLGYESFLLDTSAALGGYETVVPFTSGIRQTNSVEERGGITDISFTIGGNYKEKLMLGATLGIPSLRYRKTMTFEEFDESGNNNNDFDFLTHGETTDTRGTGVNLKLGAIYKLSPEFRIGAAFHTPTYFSLTDVKNRYVISNTENFKQSLGYFDGPITRVDGPTNEYQYSMTTPWRGVISAAAIIAKRGFITVDYEYVNYKSARLHLDDLDANYETSVNNGIKNMYKGASNLRIGGEVNLDLLMLRLGFGYYGNPYQNSSMNAERMDVSAGIGFNFDNWRVDIGYVRSMYTQDESPYFVGYSNIESPTASINNALNNIALTFAFKF